jgi:soluble lytic murein transglycosylase-like protein
MVTSFRNRETGSPFGTAVVHRARAYFCLGLLATAFWSVIGTGATAAWCADATIYVVHEADGSLRFTNRTPPAGVKAQVFRAHQSGFSTKGGRTAQRLATRDTSAYDEVIADAARLHQLEPALVKAVIHAESSFNPDAVSPKGAKGLMQLMPGTAREVGVRDALAPAPNIYGGVYYLAGLIKEFGRLDHAIAAYNAGGEHVRRHKGVPPFSETQEYVRRVLELKNRYTGKSHDDVVQKTP